MKLYSDCVKRKYGWECICTDKSFLAYSVSPHFVVEEFHIDPDFRGEDAAKEIMELAYDEAKKLNFKEVYISIFLGVKNNLKEATMYLALKHKFKITNATPTHIYMKRELF